MDRSRTLLFFTTALAAAIAGAQSGPAGIGTSATNILWLDASHGVSGSSVSLWQDRSGNNNHATQSAVLRQPNLYSNSMNGKPTVEFDNDATNNDFMVIQDHASLEGMTGLTGFVVYRLNTGTANSVPRCFFSKRDGVDLNEAYDWFIWNSGTSAVQNLDIVNTNNRVAGSVNVVAGVNHINAFTFHGAAPSDAYDQVLYDGNTMVGNKQETSTSIPNYTSHLYLGVLQGHGGGAGASRFNGSMGEVILFNQTLNDVQRILVTNYLAAKYGIALSTADVYRQDEPTNGNYDHEMAGIGRTTAGSHSDSQGPGRVRISNPTGLDNNEFLTWGHDNGVLGAWGITDLPSGVQGRWARVWRVSELDLVGNPVDVGAVDMTFDLAGQGPVVASDLRLLVDTDGDGVFADEGPIAGAVHVSGTLYRFNGTTALVNGRRFTLGTANMLTTPLPIELLRFQATEGFDEVVCSWSTASERDNELFQVERSTDLESWTLIGQVPGAGNSTSVLDYSLPDPSAPDGILYYRLKQVDFDGTATYSPTAVVHLVRSQALVAYPNPAHDRLTVHAGPNEVVELFDITGRRTDVPRTLVGGLVLFDTSDLPPGIYVVRGQGYRARSTRVVVE